MPIQRLKERREKFDIKISKMKVGNDDDGSDYDHCSGCSDCADPENCCEAFEGGFTGGGYCRGGLYTYEFWIFEHVKESVH